MDQTETSDSASDVPEAERGLRASVLEPEHRMMRSDPGLKGCSKERVRTDICRKIIMP